MNRNCWLPPLEEYNPLTTTWPDYESRLYRLFSKDFLINPPSFKGKRVSIRRHPIEFGKEECFFHITCQDYSKRGYRVPDFRRCERIRWVRAFIENYRCDSTLCKNCDGIKVWDQVYKSATRVHILLEEEKYMVVVERRNNYCLLITAFYFDQEHKLRKALKKYDEFSKKEP